VRFHLLWREFRAGWGDGTAPLRNALAHAAAGMLAALTAMLAGMSMVWYGDPSDTLFTAFALHAGKGLMLVGVIIAIGTTVTAWWKLFRGSRS
jgi:cell division protein FtsX